MPSRRHANSPTRQLTSWPTVKFARRQRWPTHRMNVTDFTVKTSVISLCFRRLDRSVSCFFCVGELACRRLGVSARCPRSTKKISIFTDIAHQEAQRPISRAVSLTLSQTVDVVNTSRVFLMIIIFSRIASHVETKTSINMFGVYTGKSSMAITPLIKNAVENFQRKKTHSAGHRLIHQDYHVLNCSSLNVAVPDTKAKFRVTDKRFCRNVC